jgi:hypothetical protein
MRVRCIVSLIPAAVILALAACSNETFIDGRFDAIATTTEGAKFQFHDDHPECDYAPGFQTVVVNVPGAEGAPSFIVGANRVPAMGPFSVDETADGGDIQITMTHDGQSTAIDQPTNGRFDFGGGNVYGFLLLTGTCHFEVAAFTETRLAGQVHCTNLERYDGQTPDESGPRAELSASFDCVPYVVD